MLLLEIPGRSGHCLWSIPSPTSVTPSESEQVWRYHTTVLKILLTLLKFHHHTSLPYVTVNGPFRIQYWTTPLMPPGGISFSYHLLVVFALILFSLVEMSFSCTPPCKGAFAAKQGLVRHQYGCPIYRTSQALKIEQRRATSQNRVHKPRSAGIIKLPGRKVRIASGSSEPKLVSTFFSHFKVTMRLRNNPRPLAGIIITTQQRRIPELWE